MTRLDRAIMFRFAVSDALDSAARALPGVHALAWRAGRRYVAGRSIDEAWPSIESAVGRGLGVSVDLFGEQVGDQAEAKAATDRFVELARRLEPLGDAAWISLDLSHIGLDFSPTFCRTQLERVVAALPKGMLVQLGAEDADRADRILEVGLAAARDSDAVGMTLQANLRRSDRDWVRLAEAGVHLRLVKGAYVERADVARPWGEQTDRAFATLARALHGAGSRLALATHDRALRESLLAELGPLECEQLLGVRLEDAHTLRDRGIPVRLYVPFGEDWFRYWMRRVAESRGG